MTRKRLMELGDIEALSAVRCALSLPAVVQRVVSSGQLRSLKQAASEIEVRVEVSATTLLPACPLFVFCIAVVMSFTCHCVVVVSMPCGDVIVV